MGLHGTRFETSPNAHAALCEAPPPTTGLSRVGLAHLLRGLVVHHTRHSAVRAPVSPAWYHALRREYLHAPEYRSIRSSAAKAYHQRPQITGSGRGRDSSQRVEDSGSQTKGRPMKKRCDLPQSHSPSHLKYDPFLLVCRPSVTN